MPVSSGVVAGSSALFGGCATAAALWVAGQVSDHAPRWACSHFTGLAPLGSVVRLEAEVVGGGQTMTHVRVDATCEGRACFTTGVALGTRPELATGRSIERPAVPAPEELPAFDLPVHAGTWAARFQWRLATPEGGTGLAAWWVRPTEQPLDGITTAAVLCDYVTYGIGRAGGVRAGGLSIDNVLRIHQAPPVESWVLLEVRADSLDGGFGSGTARVWDSDGSLLATGSQTVVLNDWDWRHPDERQ